MRAALLAVVVFSLALVASPALAKSPCAARADAYRPGDTLSGQVVRVVDGDGLWVAMGPGADRCIKIRIADFYAVEMDDPGGREAKAEMERIAAGRRVSCKAQRANSGRGATNKGRLVAVCRINGRSVGDLMRRAGVAEGGNGR